MRTKGWIVFCLVILCVASVCAEESGEDQNPKPEVPDPEPEVPDPEPEVPDPETEKPDPETEKPDPETEKPEVCTEDSCKNGARCGIGDETFCVCKEGTSGRDCTVVDDCDIPGFCGDGKDVSCMYDKMKEKAYCSCNDSRNVFDSESKTCRECECGVYEICSFVDGIKTCECENGYGKKDGVCIRKCTADPNTCKNGGVCGTEEEGPFCACKPGTSGDLCGTVDDCGVENFCGTGKDVKCKYDIGEEKAVCDCDDPEKAFESTAKVCKVKCTADPNTCEHGGVCGNEEEGPFCGCKPGTSGDLCGTVEDCGIEDFCGTGEDLTCEYHTEKEEAFCKCNDTKKQFDLEFKKCKDVCQDNSSCVHGGLCLADKEESGNKFCRCDNGTSGDFCDSVDDCVKGIVHCSTNDNVMCLWDSAEKKAKCGCKNELFYEERSETCLDCTACGENSHGCNVTEDPSGPKTCFCNPGFLQKGEKCEECDCGKRGTCYFINGEKTCHCNKGYEENNGKCEKCNCGVNGNCSFVNGEKHCDCKEKYAYNGTLCADCKCGNATGCTFEYGKKFCQCNENFAQNGQLCEECKCGKNATCSFEDGKPKCVCKPKFGLKDNECVECDCHESSIGCTFDKDKVVCLCEDGYALKDNVCTKCDCGNGNCSFVNGEKKCLCDEGYAFNDDTCEECDCGKHGTCSFDESGNPKCDCHDGFGLKDGICHATCTEGSCAFNGTCEKGDSGMFCTCLPGTSGDFCEIVLECSNSLKECTSEGGNCTYDVATQKAHCDCPDAKEFEISSEKCKITCSETSCQNQGKCTEGFCQCEEGTSGDLCDIVDGCGNLTETCQKAKAECKYAADKPGKATCICTEGGFTYDDDKQICKPTWCEQNLCSKDSDCKFENGVGYCACKDSKKYYNYEKKACQEYDSCLSKSCSENEVCENGECKCKPPYKTENNTCVPNACSKTTCVPGAECVETEIPGVAKCVCDGRKFFDGSRCIDGSCFLPDFRHNCTEKCPQDLVRDDKGICVHKNESYQCKKDCQYGSCILKNDKETCVCIPRFAKLQDDVCILNAAVVCASKQLTDDLTKCNTTGLYKYAENGITLEKKSCSDKEAVDECRNAAATCKDTSNSYECVCEDGYKKDSSGYCAEQCESEEKSKCMEKGMSCYIDESKQAKCDCPPPLALNEKTKQCDKLDKNTFILQNLPVVKKRYIRKDGSIDKVLLNSDIIRSMKLVFNNIENTYMYNYKTSEDILNCSVVLKFTKEGKTEIKRLRMLKNPEMNCTGCGENAFVLPPALVLRTESLDSVTDEEANLCSKPLTKSLCGHHADCKNNKCFCPEGFTISDYSVQTNKEYTILRCEDLDECAEDKHVCLDGTNSTCENTIGDYYCKCLPGFKKIDVKIPFESKENKDACTDLCSPNPCHKGTCAAKDKVFDCNCQLGYSGSLCNREDSPLLKANKNIKIVGAVLGTLLGVTILIFIVYVWKKKSNKYSEDFAISPHNADDTEMRAGRNMRGVTNRAYE